jgi:hypothetical protein
MANSPLDFPSTQTFRTRLNTRNLPPYPKSPTRYTPPLNFPYIQSNYSVVDSPDSLIDTPILANQLYPLNLYGANGGFNQYADPNVLNGTRSGAGEYGVQFAHIIDESATQANGLNGWKSLNAYGDGLNLIDSAEAFSTLEVLQINQSRQGNAQPYPTTFLASFYSPLSILLSDNPRGSNGSLSQDSFIARLGAKTLKKEFQDRIAREIRRQTLGRANIFNANSGTDVLGMVTGTIPLIEPNYQITVPANPITAAAQLALSLAGSTIPLSLIPGSYFDPTINSGQPTTTQQLQSAYINTAGQSSILGAVSSLLSAPKSGSQIFLENTGAGQKSRLFKNIDYNRFKPAYDRGIVDRLGGAIVGTSNSNGNYYIGSTNSEPSRILSPSRDLPVNEFGQEIQTEVYGPVELAKIYEGETSKNIKLGSNGPIYSDGGGIEGGMTWVSPKYKDNAGKKVGPGGNIIKEDPDFKDFSYGPTESTTLNFKPGSILDETQRLINSQPQGKKRYEHVGNAIDQVSKIFNDGYKELTKGSRVIAYIGEIGQEKGAEYCRVFAKDTPYLQHNDLQKTDGMTTEGRKFSFSVFDKTYNLNMYPNKREGGQDSTNLVMGGANGEYAKKYMFSLENLAWRTSNKPGYTIQDLPVCERGPNGGRVMWFPPYDLKFTEGSTASWKSTDFIGRPEPVYTYNNTNRTGSISWKIVVDHPSVLNVIVDKVLAKETNKVRIDSILESFFAGCRKYDLYDLAKKYYTVNPNDILAVQTELQYKDVSVERIRYVKQTLTTDVAGTAAITKTTPTTLDDLHEWKDKAVYFGNDYPKRDAPKDFNYTTEYNRYTTTDKPEYANNNPNGGTDLFFSNVVTANYNDMEALASKINELLSNSQNQGTITIEIAGSASAPATETYNVSLSERRINALINFFKQNSKTKDFVNSSPARLKLVPGEAKGEVAQVQQFINGNWQSANPVNCSDTNTKNGDNQVGVKDVYTTNAMACRRAVITNITTTLTAPNKEETIPAVPGTQKQEEFTTQENYTETNKVPEEVTKTVVRDNISKRVLRSLLSECNYFETIKEETPMVYDNLREKLKFFNPAFHSTTPEGLNSRLTFLQQCLRPGDTIPVTQKDGTLQYNNATNTAFGAPPVLILRVGDFFHTKIIPEGLQLTYESLDINPEGIGIQPMIANVTLSFKFVGGQGLAGAVDKLQNALTFNYYANTEMYDDRADVTDTSYKVIDKELLDYFNIQVPPPTVKQTPNINGQSNNQTIGVITSATTIQTGDVGDINYQAFMNGFKDSTQNYFRNVLNKNREVFKQFNNAVMQNWSLERNYTKGSFQAGTGNNDTYIFGKPNNIQNKIDEIFNDFVSDINSDNEGLINFLKGTVASPKNFAPRVISTLKDNYKKYITTTKKNVFQSALTKIIQDICLVEQNLILNISKANTLSYTSPSGYGTDGLQQKNGKVQIYLISGTTNVSKGTSYPDTFAELKGDVVKIKDSLISFDTLTQTGVTFNGYNGKLIYKTNEIINNQTFIPFSKLFDERYIGDVYKKNSLKRCYFILNDDIIDSTKYSTFKKALIGNILSNPSLFGSGYDALEKEFDAYWLTDDNINNLKSVKTIFTDENTLTDKFLNELENNTFKNYINFTPFDATAKREFTFTTEQQKINTEGNIQEKESLIKSLGLSTNSNNDNKTWNDYINSVYIGKVKLN